MHKSTQQAAMSTQQVAVQACTCPPSASSSSGLARPPMQHSHDNCQVEAACTRGAA
jgi:hypothetical protein